MKIILLITGFLLALFLAFKGNKEENLPSVKKSVTVDMDFDGLDTSLNEGNIVKQYSAVNLFCTKEPTSIAERVCYANIDRFNELEAKRIVFFFTGNRLLQVKVDTKASGHKIISRYSKKYGGVVMVPKKISGNEQLVAWKVKNGLLVTSLVEKTDDGMLLWLGK